MYDKYQRAHRAVSNVPECRYLSVCRSRGREFFPDQVPLRLICLPFLRPLITTMGISSGSLLFGRCPSDVLPRGSTIGADEAINDRDVQTGLSQYCVHMR